MNKLAPTLLIASVVLFAGLSLAAWPVAATSEPTIDPSVLGSAVLAPSDLFAAFLVAYDAQRASWQARGVQLSPRELIARHYAIHIARDGDRRVAVMFAPKSPFVSGGGVTYFVDTEALKVVGKKIER